VLAKALGSWQVNFGLLSQQHSVNSPYMLNGKQYAQTDAVYNLLPSYIQ